MADHKFDGTQLKKGSVIVANVRKDAICKGSGSIVVANIRGEKICKGSGSTVEFNVRRDLLCKGSGSSSVAKMRDVEKAIDGPGHIVIAALWLYFIR